MGLFLNNKDNRSELQTRLASELNERLKQKQALEYEKPEPAMLDNQHHTRAAGVILVLLSIVAVAVILYMVQS